MNDLYHRFAYWADRAPDRTSIVEAETGRRITYRHAFQAVQETRRWLGPSPRNIMALLPGGIPDALIWLTALTGGHLLFPLAPDAGDEERARAVSMYKPDVLFLERQDQARKFPLARARVLTRAESEKLIDRAPQASGAPLDPVNGYVCLMTSGTTGKPKGVILDAQQIAWTADHVRISHRLAPGDVGLTPLPLFHVNGPVVSLSASIMTGSTVVIARKFSRSHFWSWVEDYHVTWASIVPTIVAILLTTPKPAFLPGTLRFVRTGAAPLPAGDLYAFEDKFGVPAIETYGLSEAASMVTANPVPPGRRKPGSAGLPVGVSLRVCRPRQADDTELLDVPRGDLGEICVRGPSLVSSYYGNTGREAFQDGWFRTGDLGCLDDEGYIHIDGRLRDEIIRGGENIAPREVEEVLQEHPAVREAGVIGRPDRLLGEQVIAYVVLNEPWSPKLEWSLREHAAKNLSAHKVPVEFIGVDSLPRNEMGKLQHRRLQEHDAALQQLVIKEAVP